MLAPVDLLERLDRIMADLVALRAAVANADLRSPSEEKGYANIVTPADDLAEPNLLDTHSASARFGYPTNTLAKWCREEGLGVMRGGRWLVSIPRLQRRLNGGE